MKKRIGCLAGLLALLAAVIVPWAVNRQGTGTYPETLEAANHVCRIRAGAGQEFDVVGLLAQGDTVVALEMKEGSDGQTWYKLDRASLPADLDPAVEECYIRSDLLVR